MILHVYVYTSCACTCTQTFLLERARVAQRSRGEGNFNIFYQLVAGADEQLKSDLLLNAPVGKEDSNLYFEPHNDVSLVCGEF